MGSSEETVEFSAENVMKRASKTLIVDDSEPILFLMEAMLAQQGIRDVTAAGNGLKALEHFEVALRSGNPYSLVFLDIVMPVMNGQEALKRMRDMEKEAGLTGHDRSTIIMATSLHSTKDMADALIEGDCSDYIVKPFSVNELRGMLIKHDLQPN
jgi:two-component system, chemotaxis family, chemotaxis protein CheY